MKILTIDFSFEGSGYSFTHRGRKHNNRDFFALRRQAKRFGYTHYMYRNEGWVYPFSSLGG